MTEEHRSLLTSFVEGRTVPELLVLARVLGEVTEGLLTNPGLIDHDLVRSSLLQAFSTASFSIATNPEAASAYFTLRAAACGCAAAVALFLSSAPLHQLLLAVANATSFDMTLAVDAEHYPAAIKAALFVRIGGFVRVCSESSWAVPPALLHSMLMNASKLLVSFSSSLDATCGLVDLAIEILHVLLPPAPSLDFKHIDALLLALLHGDGTEVRRPVWAPATAQSTHIVQGADVTDALTAVAGTCCSVADPQALLLAGLAAMYVATAGSSTDAFKDVMLQFVERLRSMSASLDSPVMMDSIKSLLKQARRVLLGAVQLCRLAGQPRCWLEPEAITELAAAAAAALQATKDWAAASKTKSSKAQFGEIYILVDKVNVACLHAASVLCSGQPKAIWALYSATSGTSLCSPLFLSHAVLTKAAFADKAAELVAACLPNIVAGVKQLQRYSKIARRGVLSAFSRVAYCAVSDFTAAQFDDCLSALLCATDIGLDAAVSAPAVVSADSAVQSTVVQSSVVDAEAATALCICCVSGCAFDTVWSVELMSAAFVRLCSFVLDGVRTLAPLEASESGKRVAALAEADHDATANTAVMAAYVLQHVLVSTSERMRAACGAAALSLAGIQSTLSSCSVPAHADAVFDDDVELWQAQTRLKDVISEFCKAR